MKKRSHKEGSYRKLPSGNWHCQLMVGYDENGKRIIKSFTAPTKTEVQQMVRQYWDNESQKENESKDISFTKWADTWYADYENQVEMSTYWNYGFTLKKLKDHFGETPLKCIKQLDINHFIDALIEQGLSKSTIGKCKSMLVQIFSAAEDNDLIEKNPTIRAKSAKAAKAHVYAKGAYTAEDIQTIRDGISDDLIGNSIMTLLGSGIRVQELIALSKNDITPDGSLLTINKAVKMAYREPILGTTKSKKGTRMVPIAREYRPYLLYLREHGGSQHIWTSDKRESGLYTVEEFRSLYRKAMKKIPGIPYYPPHCCRHTYITQLQEKHVPMNYISALAGHESESTTLGYTHVSLDALTKVIDSVST